VTIQTEINHIIIAIGDKQRADGWAELPEVKIKG
jgi:hypothetical protein